MVPDTHLLKLLFLTRYVNCSLERSASLLASPRGEVASRSDGGEGIVSVAIKYRSSQQQFSRARRAQRKFRVEPGRSFGKI